MSQNDQATIDAAKAKEAQEAADRVTESNKEQVATEAAEAALLKKQQDDAEEAAKGPETEVVSLEPELSKTATQQVAGLITDAGLKPTDVVKMIDDNGGVMTPAIFKALADKHGEGTATLIGENLKSLHTQAANKRSTADGELYDHVAKAFPGEQQSGQDTFNELAGWAKDNVSADDRAELNAMIKRGGIQGKLAIDNLVQRFQNSDSFSQSALLIDGDSFSEDFGLQALDKVGYDRELRKLTNAGHDYNTSPEIAQLKARRQKSIARGQ